MKITLHSAENGKVDSSSIDQQRQETLQDERCVLGPRDWLSHRLGLLSWLISAIALVLLAICSICALYGLYQLENTMRSNGVTLTNLDQYLQETQSDSFVNDVSERATFDMEEWHRLFLKNLDEIRSNKKSVNNEGNDVDSILLLIAEVAYYNNQEYQVNDTSDGHLVLIANLTELEQLVISQHLMRLAKRQGEIENFVAQRSTESRRMRREVGSSESKEGKCHFHFSYNPGKGRIGGVRVSPVPKGQGMIRVSNTLNDGKNVRQCFFDIVYEPIEDQAKD